VRRRQPTYPAAHHRHSHSALLALSLRSRFALDVLC
jgi:hypothetical protein